MEKTYRLIIACPDRVGIVAKVGAFIAGFNGWITDANHYSDNDSGWFFMRYSIRASTVPYTHDEFCQRFSPIAEEFEMEWSIQDSSSKKKMLILASRQGHCLADLLHRWHSNDLDCEIPAVISNHSDLRKMTESYDIPFHHVPVHADDKQEAFEQMKKLFIKYQADVIVLARYMQILPHSLCSEYSGKIINIHHSFLPSFAGAKPYHQAYERGVKIIGATCHYVTSDLDAGPIIEQDVERISHKDVVDDMVRKGKDIERIVLAKGVRAHLEDRVLVHGNKTVVFE